MFFRRTTTLIICAALPVLGISQSLNSPKKAKGYYKFKNVKEKIYRGGTFRMNEIEDFKNLFPHSVVYIVSQHVASQVYQGLVKYNPGSLEIEPCLAKAWEIDANGVDYTFHLRRNVFFHDNACFPEGQGRAFKASDVAYCFTRLCTSSGDNKLFGMFRDRVLGAARYYEQSMAGSVKGETVPGIKVIDDYTVRITLTKPFAPFLHVLAHNACWIFPREAYQKYGTDMRSKCIGTGPFVLTDIDAGRKVSFVRNYNYWEQDEFGNRLPYLDSLKFTFNREKKVELTMMKNGQLDLSWNIRAQDVTALLEEITTTKASSEAKFQLVSNGSFGAQYYALLHTSPIFENVHVRRAFNMAVDQEKIVNDVLSGVGRPAIHGFVPTLSGYDASSVTGLAFDSEVARKELALAGYPGGRGFPVITLYFNEGGGVNRAVAETIQKMLKANLGITILVEAQSFSTLIERFTTGKYDIWRTGWLADYPDPENLLKLFYGKPVPEEPNAISFPNSHRYVNARFDSIFELALAEINPNKRSQLYMQCDQILVDDAAFLALYSDEYFTVLAENVRNLPQNAMGYQDLTHTFFSRKSKKRRKDK